MALQTRPLARPARGDVPVRPEANESADLPRVWKSGGRDGNEMPPMRREHEIFDGRGEQVPRTLDAADLSCHVRHAYDLLRDVWTGNYYYHEATGVRGTPRRSY